MLPKHLYYNYDSGRLIYLEGIRLLVHTPEADGNLGAPTTYAASALLAARSSIAATMQPTPRP